MPPSELLNAFLQGNPPKNLKLAVARGVAPLSSDELLQVLVHLDCDAEHDVASEACNTIRGLSEDDLLEAIGSRHCSVKILDYFARHSDTPSILEGILMNPSTPAAAVEAMAARVSESLMEAILYNHVRILECPGILAQLLLNPALTPATDRMVREIELEFFGEKRKDYSVGPQLEEAASAPAAAAAAEVAMPPEEEEILPDALRLEGLPLDPNEREATLGERFDKMTVPQKIRFAMHGNREARAVLIRDPNKEVSRSVLKSPKLSESEIQAFAAMRNLPDELLRVIGESRQWTRNYTVVQNLVRNPKTPPLTALHLLNRLHWKDLTQLSRDRAVSEAVRRNAQRMLTQRNAKGTLP